MSASIENVLAVPRGLFEEIGEFQGVCLEPEPYLKKFLKRENNVFLARPKAEEDPSYKQIIPYAVLTHGGRILRYYRGSKSGEKRLVAKASVGIGGHINDGDEGLFTFDESAYRAAVEREIHEELVVGDIVSDRIVALLNDDSNDVGRVHLGVVHVIELAEPEARPNEKAITKLEFRTHEEIRSEDYDCLETWSQIVIDNWKAVLDGGLRA